MEQSGSDRVKGMKKRNREKNEDRGSREKLRKYGDVDRSSRGSNNDDQNCSRGRHYKDLDTRKHHDGHYSRSHQKYQYSKNQKVHNKRKHHVSSEGIDANRSKDRYNLKYPGMYEEIKWKVKQDERNYSHHHHSRKHQSSNEEAEKNRVGGRVQVQQLSTHEHDCRKDNTGWDSWEVEWSKDRWHPEPFEEMHGKPAEKKSPSPTLTDVEYSTKYDSRLSKRLRDSDYARSPEEDSKS